MTAVTGSTTRSVLICLYIHLTIWTLWGETNLTLLFCLQLLSCFAGVALWRTIFWRWAATFKTVSAYLTVYLSVCNYRWIYLPIWSLPTLSLFFAASLSVKWKDLLCLGSESVCECGKQSVDCCSASSGGDNFCMEGERWWWWWSLLWSIHKVMWTYYRSDEN